MRGLVEISLLQNAAVMGFVTGDNEAKCAYTEFIGVDVTLACKHLLGECLKQIKR